MLPADMPTVPPQPTRDPGRLTGVKIGIDPGHQAQGNNGQEAVAPGSSETKAKVSSGTYGRFTGVPEYEVNLDISLQLREALEALGCEVYMTRETNDVDISNQERAIMMNELGVDLVLRIHCNGSTNRKRAGHRPLHTPDRRERRRVHARRRGAFARHGRGHGRAERRHLPAAIPIRASTGRKCPASSWRWAL